MGMMRKAAPGVLARAWPIMFFPPIIHLSKMFPISLIVLCIILNEKKKLNKNNYRKVSSPWSYCSIIDKMNEDFCLSEKAGKTPLCSRT